MNVATAGVQQGHSLFGSNGCAQLADIDVTRLLRAHNTAKHAKVLRLTNLVPQRVRDVAFARQLLSGRKLATGPQQRRQRLQEPIPKAFLETVPSELKAELCSHRAAHSCLGCGRGVGGNQNRRGWGAHVKVGLREQGHGAEQLFQ